MRLVFFISICFFFLSQPLFSQVLIRERTLSIQGFITNETDKNIENVHVVNVSANRGTTSDFSGLFNVVAALGDTIRFTCVGYIPANYHVPFYTTSPILPLHVRLIVDTVQISGVNIYPWPSDAVALKKAVLAMETQTPETPDLKLNDFSYKASGLPVGAPKPNIPGVSDPGLTYTVAGPITAMYNAFSKSAKSNRKLGMLESADERKVLASKRYNAEVVKRVTSFTSEKEIQVFMLFCNLTVDFIVSSSEYDLYKAIHECLLAYNVEPEK